MSPRRRPCLPLQDLQQTEVAGQKLDTLQSEFADRHRYLLKVLSVRSLKIGDKSGIQELVTMLNFNHYYAWAAKEKHDLLHCWISNYYYEWAAAIHICQEKAQNWPSWLNVLWHRYILSLSFCQYISPWQTNANWIWREVECQVLACP